MTKSYNHTPTVTTEAQNRLKIYKMHTYNFGAEGIALRNFATLRAVRWEW